MTENVVKEGSYKRSISALNHHHKPKFKSEAKIQKSVFLPDHYTKYILYNRTPTHFVQEANGNADMKLPPMY